MVIDPKYRIGQEVWFASDNEEILWGKITKITPVNYNLLYSIFINSENNGNLLMEKIYENCIFGDISIRQPISFDKNKNGRVLLVAGENDIVPTKEFKKKTS